MFDKVSKEDICWFAGLFDGEGCIRIRKAIKKKALNPSYAGYMTICMTHEDTISKLKKLFGGSMYKNYYSKNKNMIYVWMIGQNATKELIKLIKPYSITKLNELLLMEEFLELSNAYRTSNKGYLVTENGGRTLPPSIINQREKLFIKMKDLKQTSKVKNPKFEV